MGTKGYGDYRLGREEDMEGVYGVSIETLVAGSPQKKAGKKIAAVKRIRRVEIIRMPEMQVSASPSRVGPGMNTILSQLDRSYSLRTAAPATLRQRSIWPGSRGKNTF